MNQQEILAVLHAACAAVEPEVKANRGLAPAWSPIKNRLLDPKVADRVAAELHPEPVKRPHKPVKQPVDNGE